MIADDPERARAALLLHLDSVESSVVNLLSERGEANSDDILAGDR